VNKYTLLERIPIKLAERVGFEPTDSFTPSLDFESSAFDQLSHLSALQSIINTTGTVCKGPAITHLKYY
jgi:hypothetical protein